MHKKRLNFIFVLLSCFFIILELICINFEREKRVNVYLFMHMCIYIDRYINLQSIYI